MVLKRKNMLHQVILSAILLAKGDSMKTTKEKDVKNTPFEEKTKPGDVIETEPMTEVGDLFSRAINSREPVKSITLKRTLTKPLVAMAHTKQLLMTCTSDMYMMELPLKGRSAEMSDVRVVDIEEI